MQDINLPRHVVAALEKKWAERLQQQAAAWRTGKPPVRSRTEAGVVVEHRLRRPRLAPSLPDTV
jgi:hypothetical protein